MQNVKKILIRDFPNKNQEEIIARYYLEALLHLRDRLNFDQNIELIGMGEGISACTAILELLKKQFVNHDVQINTSQSSEMHDVEDHKSAQIHMQFRVKEFLPDNLTIFEYVDKYMERILELKQKANQKIRNKETQDIQKEVNQIITSNQNITKNQLQQQQQQQQQYKDYPFNQKQQYQQINPNQNHDNKFEKHNSKQNQNKKSKQKNKYNDIYDDDDEIFSRNDNEFHLLDNSNKNQESKHDKNTNKNDRYKSRQEQEEMNRNKVREQNQRDVKNYREDRNEEYGKNNYNEQKLYEQDLTPQEYVSLLEKGQTKTRGQRRNY